MLRRIDMVAIYVRDWVGMVDWYESVLGFTRLYVEDDHQFAVLGLPDGGAVLHLVGSPVGQPGTRNRCVPNVAVNDFDATLRTLQERGVTVLEVQDETDDGYRLARIADPEHNDLNLYISAS